MLLVLVVNYIFTETKMPEFFNFFKAIALPGHPYKVTHQVL